MSTTPPLLRSPPFPWVEKAVSAVAIAGQSRLHDPDRFFVAMRDSRVGGEFWNDGIDPVLDWIWHGIGDQREAAIAAIEAYAYRDPFTGATIDAHAAVDILAGWRATLDANRPIDTAVGMAGWKRQAIAQFLWDGRESPRFSSPSKALSHKVTAYWPSRVPADFAGEGERAGVATWQVEDGFIRSTGLGAECRPPMSIIVDRTGGVHFDPSVPNELENVLANHRFDDGLLARAARLRERIVAARLGKYGVDRGAAPPDLPAGRRIVLAVGQVQDDLSVLRGGAGGLEGFVARVRACEPEAFIVYRPHPDVVAGLRRGDLMGAGEADLVLEGGSLLALVERADAVHVHSSLTGFEALLRGVAVTTHGLPFYAGWGLTTDRAAVPSRRGRQLSLDELVAAALILVPRYRDPVTELPCPVEVLVDRLAADGRPQHNLVTGFRKALGASQRRVRQGAARA